MSEHIGSAATVDVPLLVAELIVDTGLLDALCGKVARVLRALPSRLAAWFGPDLHTPDNSAAPSVTFADGELWNGIVFVEASEPAFWLLVKAGPDRRQRGFRDQRRPSNPSGAQTWAQDGGPYWEEPYSGEPWERESWRR